MYGGEVRPELFLILSKTPSHAFSNCSGESMSFVFGAAGWKIVAVVLKQVRKACQSRLSKAVTNADKASSTEAVFGSADLCCRATIACEVAIANNPTTMYFFQCMLRTSDHPRSISAGKSFHEKAG